MKVKVLVVQYMSDSHTSLIGSSAHRILQARILEWVAIFFSRGSSDLGIEPGSPAWQANSLLSEPAGKPYNGIVEGKSKDPCSLYLMSPASSTAESQSHPLTQSPENRGSGTQLCSQ